MKPRGEAGLCPKQRTEWHDKARVGTGKLAREWTGSPGFLAPKGLEEAGGGAGEGNAFEMQILGPELWGLGRTTARGVTMDTGHPRDHPSFLTSPSYPFKPLTTP